MKHKHSLIEIVEAEVTNQKKNMKHKHSLIEIAEAEVTNQLAKDYGITQYFVDAQHMFHTCHVFMLVSFFVTKVLVSCT